MLSKPIGLLPDNENISIEDGYLNLSAQILSGGDFETFIDDNGIERAVSTLAIHSDGTDYTFEFGNESNAIYAPLITDLGYSKRLDYKLPVDRIGIQCTDEVELEIGTTTSSKEATIIVPEEYASKNVMSISFGFSMSYNTSSKYVYFGSLPIQFFGSGTSSSSEYTIQFFEQGRTPSPVYVIGTALYKSNSGTSQKFNIDLCWYFDVGKLEITVSRDIGDGTQEILLNKFTDSSRTVPVESVTGLNFEYELSASLFDHVGKVIGYSWKESSTYGVHMKKKPFLLKEVLKENSLFVWKMRLYNKGSVSDEPAVNLFHNKIGYGAFNSTSTKVYDLGIEITIHSDPYTKGYTHIVGDTYVDTDSYSVVGYRYSVFPHVNIYSNLIGCNGNDDGKVDVSTKTSVVEEVYIRRDNFQRYAIKSRGNMYQIKHYSFAPFVAVSGDVGDIHYSECFDSYGNPLNGYVCIGKEIENLAIGDTYEIYCNYIESNNAYFTIVSKPSIECTLTNDNVVYDSEIYSADNPYVINYNNAEIDISFVQDNGIQPNFFSYKVFELSDDGTGEYMLVYSSGNQYNQKLHCSYDRIFNDKHYVVVIYITDTSGMMHEYTLYLKSDFPFADKCLPLQPSVSLYKEHNSIIVDWSKFKSVQGVLSSDDYSYVDFGIVEDDNALQLNECTLRYFKDGTGNNLNFLNPTTGLVFKGFDNTSGKLMDIVGNDIQGCIEYTDSRYIDLRLPYKTYRFDLYSDLTSETTLDSELLNESDGNAIPYVWDDSLTWNDSYYWHESNRISNGVWVIVFNSNNCVLYNYNNGEFIKYEAVAEDIENTFSYDFSDEFKNEISLYGNAVYKALTVINNFDSDLDEYAQIWYNWYWSEKTQLLSNFNGTTNGICESVYTDNISLLSGEAEKQIVGFRVYRRNGLENNLYEVANILDPDVRIIEDYTVGDNCEYKYYIYPIIGVLKDGKIDGASFVGSITETDSIILNEGVDKVFALKEIADRVYEVDTSQVWRLYLNLKDGGYTLNTDNVFYDTLSRYGQEYVGQKNYITKSVEALIGTICPDTCDDYIDTYDMLNSWNSFVTSNCMKCLVELRGLVLPGAFENNMQIKYIETDTRPASASFTWRQTADLDIIKIYATCIPFNPASNEVALVSSDGKTLLSSEPYLLTSDKG